MTCLASLSPSCRERSKPPRFQLRHLRKCVGVLPANVNRWMGDDTTGTPLIGFDGRWPIPTAKVIGYIRAIENPSLRNTVALFSCLKDSSRYQFYLQLAAWVPPMRVA